MHCQHKQMQAYKKFINKTRLITQTIRAISGNNSNNNSSSNNNNNMNTQSTNSEVINMNSAPHTATADLTKQNDNVHSDDKSGKPVILTSPSNKNELASL